MALFGGLSKAVSGYNKPGGDGLAFADKLGALGALLMGDQNAVMQAKQMGMSRQEQERKRAMQAELANVLGLGGPSVGQPPPTVPRGPIGPDSGMAPPPMQPPRAPPQAPQRAQGAGLPSLRAIGPDLLRLQMGGLDINPIVNVLDKAGPQVRYERGMRYDERDPNSAPAFVPDMDKGQMPLFDAQGNIVAVRNIDGSVQSAAEMAAAVEGAKARATAPYEFVNLPTPTGAPMVASKAQAAGRVFQGQDPASRVYAEGASKEQVERDFTRPKAEAALAAMDAKTRVVDDAIERAIQGVGGWTAGPGAMLSAIPGSPAKDLQANLETIKANLGFDELQTMRDNSPTGGALGQVAVQELEALRSTLSSLDQAQSPEQLRSSLERVRQIRQGSAQRRREAFSRTYGGQGGQGGGARPDRGAIEAELRRRGLIR